MVRVAPIKLQVGPKVLWFDPAGLDIHEGDGVIVSTKRGREYGIATSDVLEVSDELVAELKSGLSPVERIATPEDEAQVAELEKRGDEALGVFREFAEKSNEDMHPVFVEFLFDGDKAVFYFEAEERVDFRDLVRRLAAHFHVRVDMRQIGVRDGARIIGGLGHCGQELCCKRMGGEFSPVSIRMAKEQNLSLNPQKISGVCGRLMCCLRYEYETYKEFNSRAPKFNAKVDTPAGCCKVCEINVPKETISLRTPEGKTVKVPLADFEPPEEGRRPHVVGEEAFQRASEPENPLQAGAAASSIEVTSFTGEEKLADPTKRSRSTKDGEEPAREGGRRRRSRGGRSGSDSRSDQRSSKQQGGKSKPQHAAKSEAGKKSDAAKQGDGTPSKDGPSRRRRRRPRSAGAEQREGSRQGQQAQGAKKDSGKSSSGRPKGSVRPGHKSSGLRNAESASGAGGQKQPSSHRTSRRRSHTAGKDASHE